jgi:hypothetical protein
VHIINKKISLRNHYNLCSLKYYFNLIRYRYYQHIDLNDSYGSNEKDAYLSLLGQKYLKHIVKYPHVKFFNDEETCLKILILIRK